MWTQRVPCARTRAFGGVSVNAPKTCCRSRCWQGSLAPILALVEEVVNRLRHLRADPADGGKIGGAGARDGLGRAEMLKQCSLARRSNAGDLIERVGADRLAAPGAVAADGEAVGFIA